MPEYNKLNLKDDVEDQAPNFGLVARPRSPHGPRRPRA